MWRVFALCRSDYARWLFVPVIFLILTIGTACFAVCIPMLKSLIACVLGTIGVRVATFFFRTNVTITERLNLAIDAFQFGTLLWSVFTNVSATSIIGHKTWSEFSSLFWYSADVFLGDIDERFGSE